MWEVLRFNTSSRALITIPFVIIIFFFNIRECLGQLTCISTNLMGQLA